MKSSPHAPLTALYIVIMSSILITCSCKNSEEPTTPPSRMPPAILHSGDTITVVEIFRVNQLGVVKHGKRAMIRLIGVNGYDNKLTTPEAVMVNKHAKDFLAQLLMGKDATITFDGQEKDTLGNYLVHLHFKGMYVNQQLLLQGFAVQETSYKHKFANLLQQAQQKAITNSNGLWSHPPSKNEMLHVMQNNTK